MTKKSKNPKARWSTPTPPTHRTQPLSPTCSSPTPPRATSHAKLINRFYEPLVLLRMLGQVRGDRTAAEVFSGSQQCIRRRFLRNLCSVCDYKKGGDTTTAIAVSESPEKHTFWIGSNVGAAAKMVSFVKEVLKELEKLSQGDSMEHQEERFEARCVEFASSRVKSELQLLGCAGQKCVRVLNSGRAEDKVLAEWLTSLISLEDIFEVSRRAYQTRKSNQLLELGKRAGRPTERHRGSTKEAFAEVRHYIGRLAHHIRAPRELIADSRDLRPILDSYLVKAVPFIQSVPRPVAKVGRDLTGILRRMLSSNLDRLRGYEEALAFLDAKFNLLGRVKEQFEDKNFIPMVHAEVQVLDHFHNNTELSFASNDRYVACSKPACYCCHLYFRFHPTRPVEPGTHQKIWHKWGPPASTCSKDDNNGKRQREILDKMLDVIRDDVFRDIDDQDRHRRWHADSHTGITESIMAEEVGGDDDNFSDVTEIDEEGFIVTDIGDHLETFDSSPLPYNDLDPLVGEVYEDSGNSVSVSSQFKRVSSWFLKLVRTLFWDWLRDLFTGKHTTLEAQNSRYAEREHHQ